MKTRNCESKNITFNGVDGTKNYKSRVSDDINVSLMSKDMSSYLSR